MALNVNNHKIYLLEFNLFDIKKKYIIKFAYFIFIITLKLKKKMVFQILDHFSHFTFITARYLRKYCFIKNRCCHHLSMKLLQETNKTLTFLLILHFSACILTR